MKIESYSFGRITVDGKTYTSDVILYADRVDAGWWRKEGHGLIPQDMPQVLESPPDVLIIGTGHSGCLTVPESTRRQIESKGIEVRVMPTTEACEEYNRLSKTKKVVAGLHLTC